MNDHRPLGVRDELASSTSASATSTRRRWTLDHVKGKAGRIRRTRRLAVAGGALAAAAVIVPIVVFAGGNLTNESGPEPRAEAHSQPHRHRPLRPRLRLPRG